MELYVPLPFVVALGVVEQVALHVQIFSLAELLGLMALQAVVDHALDQLLGPLVVVRARLLHFLAGLGLVVLVRLFFLVIRLLVIFVFIAAQQLDLLVFIVRVRLHFILVLRVLFQELPLLIHLHG